MSKDSEGKTKHASVVLDYQNNQRALRVIKSKGHGSMRALVGNFIRAYLKSPDQVYLYILQVIAGQSPLPGQSSARQQLPSSAGRQSTKSFLGQMASKVKEKKP